MKSKRWLKSFLMVLLIGLSFLSLGVTVFSAEGEEGKWKGVDEAVIEKIAKERGVIPKEPLFSLEGDLELFAFSLLSGGSGFVAGYYWRKLIGEKSDASSLRKTTS
ncbi:MAG: hypothetical protein RMI74_01625 [Thermodesulfobacterium sp.]|nr:hypothetical protein [Caldimicrobium sp.]MDW8135477.1 hypothetical protein [Thermodesulfobacterium sp.]